MNKKIYVRKEGSDHIVEKQSFPRMNLKIDCNKSIPEIKEIKVLEECGAAAIIKGIEEIWKILIRYLRK